jgi:hypothetical protein
VFSDTWSIIEQPDAVAREGGHQILFPAGVLVIDHLTNAARGGAKGFCGGKSIDAALDGIAFHLLLQAGDADFEKLIEVRADDAEEFQAFQQRILRVHGFVQDALVEFQPAQLAIEETRGMERPARSG